MAIAHVATVTSKTANNQTNTSLSVALGSTTIGDLNVIEIVGKVDGTGINAGYSTPAGWTKLGEAFDSGTTSSATTAIFYRFFQSGDPLSVTVSWTNAGQAAAISSGYSGVDTTTPIPVSQIEPKGTTDTTYSVSLTISSSGWIRSGFGNRSGDVPTGLADTTRGSTFNTSASTIIAQDTAADATAGTYTKSAAGTNSTSVGSEWAYLLKPASAGAIAYQWTVDEGLTLGEIIGTSSLATVDTYTDALGLTDTIARVLNSSPTSTPRTADFTFKLELAPTSTPATAFPTYTEVTDYVVLRDDVDLSRGRENEGSTDAQPGRGSWTMRNEGGTFTPGDSDSAFAPFQLRRPFRWSVTVDGISYSLWQGFLDGVTTFRDGLNARARMSCSDRVARLGGYLLTRLPDGEIALDDPVYAWPLRDTDPAPFAQNGDPLGIRTSNGVGSGTVSFTNGFSASGVSGDAVAQFTRADATKGMELWLRKPSNSATITSWAMEVLIAPSSIAKMAAIARTQTNENVDQWGGVPVAIECLGINATGLPFFEINDGPSATLTGTTPVPINAWTHLAVVVNGAGVSPTGTRLYVNGQLVASDPSTPTLNPVDLWLVGGITDYTTFPSWAPFDGRIAYAAFYDNLAAGGVGTALAASRIADHATLLTGTESASDRFARLCTNAGIPSALWVTPPSSVEVGTQDTDGRTLLDAINAITAVDGGDVFADPDGILTYSSAAARYNRPVELVLDSTTMVLVGTELTVDDSLLVNDVTYTGNDGVPARAFSASSIASFDKRTVTQDIPTVDWTASYVAAAWVLTHRATPGQRSSGIAINVQAFKDAGGSIPALLSLDVGSRIQVASIADGLATVSVMDLFVEGIKDRFGKGGWVRTLMTSPVGLYGSIFTLDDPVHGVLDGSQILGL